MRQRGRPTKKENGVVWFASRKVGIWRITGRRYSRQVWVQRLRSYKTNSISLASIRFRGEYSHASPSTTTKEAPPETKSFLAACASPCEKTSKRSSRRSSQSIPAKLYRRKKTTEHLASLPRTERPYKVRNRIPMLRNASRTSNRMAGSVTIDRN
jgi:hypothetical protein